ncbi:tetratricopeptide repeat protein [Kineosporia sp. A_224]|uniref:tetratricopeptide repeat protein n=1 Tax=Kineosporia sp. A_224 TaxID=1962180 RepID=UPI000B4A9B04|nr:tetratricopeptide repeat protein [Kineosporia sp. A_224]
MTTDVRALWDFRDPGGSRARFEAALEEATGDDALVLRTQVARTHGLARDFDTARAVLAGVEPHLDAAGPRATAYYWLELGRTYSSATHEPASQTDEVRAAARAAFERCIAVATAGGLDGLVVDAVHMLAFADPTPEAGVRWADVGLEVALASDEPDARRWEATLRNNRGIALGQLDRHEESLADYERALDLVRPLGDPTRTRIAEWMVASALRHLGRLDDAKAVQLRLEAEWDADGEPDPYVFEELEAIFRAQGDDARAAHYAARQTAAAADGEQP